MQHPHSRLDNTAYLLRAGLLLLMLPLALLGCDPGDPAQRKQPQSRAIVEIDTSGWTAEQLYDRWQAALVERDWDTAFALVTETTQSQLLTSVRVMVKRILSNPPETLKDEMWVYFNPGEALALLGEQNDEMRQLLMTPDYALVGRNVPYEGLVVLSYSYTGADGEARTRNVRVVTGAQGPLIDFLISQPDG